MNFRTLSQRIVNLWTRFTDPIASVQQPEQRRQSRLLASLAFVLLVLTLLVVGLNVTIVGSLLGHQVPLAIGSFDIFLLVSYQMSRYGRYQLAALLLVTASSVLVFVASFSGTLADINFLNSLLIAIIISSVFLSPRVTLAVSAAHLLGMLAFAAVAPPPFGIYILSYPLSIVLVGSVLIWLFSYHRQRLEADRQGQLAQSETRYRIISEMMSDYVYAVRVVPDAEYKTELEWVAGALSRITGYSPEEATAGIEWLAHVHPDDCAIVQQHRQRLLAGQKDVSEYRMVSKQDELYWLRSYTYPVWDETQGRVVRIYAAIQDVTERKQAEQALRDSEEKNRILVELAREGIFIETVEGRILDCNPAGCKMFGYAKDEIIGMDARDLVPDGFDAPLSPFIVEITGGEYRERVNKKKDCTLFPTEVSAEFFAVGGEKRLIAFVRDITERKQAEAALRASEERYRILSGMLSDYAYSYRVEPDGSFVHEWITDEAFLHVTGYTWQEIDAMEPFALFHPDERAELPRQQEMLRQGQSVSADYRIITKSGEERWLRISRHPVWDESENRLARFYCIAEDITERKQGEEQQLKLTLERERLTLVSRFVLAVSHDFRTALANIETSRYLIERQLPEANRASAQPRLRNIQRAIAHLTEQIGNLNTISFLAEPNTQPCNLNMVVEAVVAEQTERAQEKNLTLDFHADADLPLLHADKDELRRAIRHLLVNAITYTPEDGTITLSTAQSNGQVTVVVADTGVGIDPQRLAYIFDPFYRADWARPIESGGIGLGLSIVKMVAEAHGGSITVKSDPGEGSVFTVTLPVSTPQG